MYMPEDKDSLKGVVQIIHDMAEYQGRYRELAQFLMERGYAVLTSDLKGHGNNIERSADLGFFCDNAVSRLTGNIHENTMYIRNTFPGKPYFIFGFGMGALIASVYFKKYDNFTTGMFMFSIPAYRPVIPAHQLIIKLFSTLKGEYHRSKIVNAMIMGPLTRHYSKEGSSYAWLSSDIDSVYKYEADPKCGYIYTLNGFQTLLELMQMTYINGSWIRKNTGCPVRIFSGADDPAIINNANMLRTVHTFSDNGYSNVGYIVYPGQRHELIHDTKSRMVFRDILKELDKICDNAPQEDIKPKKSPIHIILEDFIDPELSKPLIKEEKINLDEFINTYDDNSGDQGSRVEMID